MFLGTGGRRFLDRLRKMQKNREREQRKIVEKENRLTEQAEANYLAEQEAKEARQSKGLGSLITPARNETEEEIAVKKKKQGLGAVISSGGSTLG